MTSIVSWLDQRLYPNHSRNWDDKIFRERILARVAPGMVLLDVGAGAGVVREMRFRGEAARIYGIDLDPRVYSNPYLDEGRIADAAKMPFDDATFDLAFADNLVEHLENPFDVFAEIKRVLKPGGLFLFKTPNRTHYVPLIARMTPHRFHQVVNRLRGRAESDTFPTLYRANTRRAILKVADQTGLSVNRVERIEGRPEYMRATGLTYLLGFAYERVVNLSRLFEPFRILLVAEFQKPEAE